MKIENKELFPLKNGCLFVILTVFGKRGERISLAKQGISRKLVFFHEAPTPQSLNYRQTSLCKRWLK